MNDEPCLCGHPASKHFPECLAPDSYGIDCTCPTWTNDDSCPEDPDDE